MKRILTVLLLVSLAASAAVAQAPTVPGIKGKSIEINFWTHDDANRNPMEKELIAEFMAANPGVTVNYSSYPSGKIFEKLTTAFAANQGPSIFNVAIGNAVSFLDNGRVAPVDYKAIGLRNAAALEGLYLPGMLSAVKRDKDIYGLPLELTNMCLYVNKKMFREAGLDPDKDYPRTWEDVMALSEKIVQRDGQIITRRGFDFRTDAYPNTFIPMVEQLGGEYVSKDGKTAIIGDEAWIKALQFMKDFGPTGKNLGAPTYTAARTAFDKNKGEVAMSFSGLYQEARMKNTNPDFYNSKDWMVVPFPQWKDAKKRVTANYSGHYYMVNVQSDKLVQKASWVLLNYMLGHGERYLEKVAVVQPTKKLTQSATYRAMPYSDVFTKDFDAAKIVYIGPASSRLSSLLKAAIESVEVGGEDPRVALEKLRKAAQAALDDVE
ncbi:MAG: extracellular solute-binding protein [Spirochaetes bacterium]|nr:extracellular solute-binding protein [Spirochaetota bacterium]MBU1079941.1 extracellular solute-binding protein [Spirochaetota bacterium]